MLMVSYSCDNAIHRGPVIVIIVPTSLSLVPKPGCWDDIKLEFRSSGIAWQCLHSALTTIKCLSNVEIASVLPINNIYYFVW